MCTCINSMMRTRTYKWMQRSPAWHLNSLSRSHDWSWHSFSSLPSAQSLSPSHLQIEGIHWKPVSHMNLLLGQDGFGGVVVEPFLQRFSSSSVLSKQSSSKSHSHSLLMQRPESHLHMGKQNIKKKSFRVLQYVLNCKTGAKKFRRIPQFPLVGSYQLTKPTHFYIATVL